MRVVSMGMKQEQLDVLLQALARKPLPTCPPDLNASVWRAIRMVGKRPRSFDETFNDLVDSVWRINVIASSAFAAFVVGVAITFSFQVNAPDATARALSLRVFSADAPSLPSTLIGQGQ